MPILFAFKTRYMDISEPIHRNFQTGIWKNLQRGVEILTLGCSKCGTYGGFRLNLERIFSKYYQKIKKMLQVLGCLSGNS